MADTGRTVWADGFWADDFWATGLWSDTESEPVVIGSADRVALSISQHSTHLVVKQRETVLSISTEQTYLQ